MQLFGEVALISCAAWTTQAMSWSVSFTMSSEDRDKEGRGFKRDFWKRKRCGLNVCVFPKFIY